MKGFYCGTIILFLLSSACLAQVKSITTGDWNNINTWDCGCVPDFNSGSITVSAFTTVTIPSGYTTTSDQIVVEGDGILDISGKLIVRNSGSTDLLIQEADFISTFADGRVNVKSGGIVENRSLISSNASTLIFEGGSEYQHNLEGGAIPIATWQSLSTCRVTGIVATVPSGLNQSFHHFIWDCSGQTAPALFLNGQLATVHGNFSILNSASKFLALGYSAGTLTGGTTVDGDMIISGKSKLYVSAVGTYTLEVLGNTTITADPDNASNYPLLGTASGTVTLNARSNFDFSSNRTIRLVAGAGTCVFNVSGNISIANGTIEMSTGAGVGTVAAAKDVSFTSGAITETSTGSGAFTFTGPGLQLYTGGGVFSNTINFLINSGATVDLKSYSLSGTGGFTNNGILKVGSTDASGAIQVGTSSGNITVSGARTYASGSTIIYNGSGSQFMGNGQPSTTNVHTIVDNSAGVTLATDVSITGNLTLTSGNLSVGSHTLTLEGDFSPNSNSLNVTANSSIIINGIGPFGVLATSGSSSIKNLTVNRSTSGSITLGSDLTVTGTLTQTIGDITLNKHTLTVAGPYLRTNGSINVDANASLTVSGTGALPAAVTFAGDQVLNSLTVNRSGATFATNSSIQITNLNLLSGTFDNTGTITIATGGVITRTEGSFINNTPSAVTSYDIIYNIATDISTGSEIPAAASALRHVTKTGGALLTLARDITINGDLTLSNGSFKANGQAVELKGDFIANAASTLTASTITFSGTSTISGGSPVEFGKIVITGTLTPGRNIQIDGDIENNGMLNAGTATTTFGGTTTISGSSTSSFNNVLITGALTAPAASMNVAGNFTNNGTFNHSNGTVVFNGTSTIGGTASTSFFGVSISGIFTAPSATVLNVAGNLNNTGTFNHNNGTILLNGTTSAQSITGTFTLNDVNVSNPSKVNNNGVVNLVGALTLLSSGAFDADGSGSGVLTIKSTSVTAGGRIAALTTPANFSGRVTVERFVNGPDNWRYLSMPLISNNNVGVWKSIFPVTGNFSDPSPVGVDNVVSSTDASIYSWNSTTQAYVAVGSGGSTSSTNLSNLTGYSVYTYLSGDFTISARGNIKTGNASIPIASSGYALVPNPYPSPIDWDNITRTGLSNTMSIRVANGVFASYVAGGLATNAPYPTWTGEVATGQSFWVESTGATSVSLTESAKTGGQAQFLRVKEPENYLRIALSSENQRDEAIVWFVDGATDGYDPSLDARKMFNGDLIPGAEKMSYLNLSILSLVDSSDYAINAVGPLSCNTSIKLRVKDVKQGNHSLEFTNLETLKLGYQVILVDRFKSAEKIVTNGFRYEFAVSEDSASFAVDRFELRVLTPGAVYINSQVPPSISIPSTCDPTNVGVKIDTQSGVSYQFFKDGRAIGQPVAGNGDLIALNIPKDNLIAGTNKFDLEVSVIKGCDRFLYRDALGYNYVPVEPIIITQEGTTLNSNISTGNQWYRDDEVIPGAIDTSLDVTESGNYSVLVSFGGCSVESEHLEVSIDPLAEHAFKVYPNPVRGHLIVELPDEIARDLREISLYDLKGLKIFENVSTVNLGSAQEKTIDMTGIRPGVYVLILSTGERTYYLKIIRE